MESMSGVVVSIIIPVYQVSEYIERCLRSVVKQDYPQIECIIVDDATKDDSIEKCERLIAEANPNLLETAVAEQATIGRADHNLDHNLDVLCKQSEQARANGKIRFKILHHEVNRGLSAARNTGINEASGEYIYFLDGDDEITSDCISKLVAVAKETPDAEMIIGNFKCIPRNEHHVIEIDKSLPEAMDTNETIATYYFSRRIPVTAWNKLVKRSFVIDNGLFFKEGVVYEDIHWSFFVVKHLTKIRILKDVTYLYYIRSGSIISNTADVTVGKSYYEIYNEILHELTKGRERQELACYAESFCNRYLRHKAILPEYKELYTEYRQKAKTFGCKTASLKLRFAYLLGHVPFGVKVLETLKYIKNNMKIV
jgi:glycosyltransferase involved in cell wall biosynthesis